MGQFIDFLLSNPLILIILGGWLLSSLGSLGAKAARKAAQQQQEQARQARRAGEQGLGRQSATVQSRPQPPPAARREAPKPEDIAAEIRRMMGLEEAPPMTRPEPVAASEEPAVARSPRPQKSTAPPIFIEDADRVPVARSEPMRATPSRSTGGMAARSDPVTRRRRRPGHLLDLSHPAAVFVAIDVLGPPRAVRGFDQF